MEKDEKIVLAMVGLPARGKSYIARKLARFLNWADIKAQVFNIGMYRRYFIGVDCDSKFFDHNNKEAQKARDQCAIEAMNDMISYLNSNIFLIILLDEGDVGIIDGTNTTVQRRKTIDKYLKENMTINFKIIWIESVCTDPNIIEKNILKTKVTSPDYKNWNDVEKAAEDFRNRIKEYEKIYESINLEKDGTDFSYIQLINQGERIVMRNIRGFIESKVVSYLMNLHTGDRPIYFARHGESEYNRKNLIGGDSNLTDKGVLFVERLAEYFKEESKSFNEYNQPPQIYSSTMKRCVNTANKLSFLNTPIMVRSLDELYCGLLDGSSYEQLKETYPDEYEVWNKDKLHFRFPRGESYLDVIQRIEPMIYEIERQIGPVIIIGHLGILRCLYGYFSCAPSEVIPNLDIPLHTVIKFVPEAYGFTEKRYAIDPESGLIKEDNSIIKFEENLIHKPKK